MENVALIDVSLEDDLLIADDYTFSDLPNSENHDPQKMNFMLEFANSCEGWNPGKISKQLEQAPEFSESPGLKQAKPGRVNMRKSLAWDSEFFTSEGVLDTEELAIVNSTFRKAEGCTLPGIQEDLRKSSESTSTLDSESYALENHEVDLFGNLRASVQMSLGKCDKASIGVPDAPCLGLKKVEFSNKMKPPVKLRRDVMSKQQLQCTSKKNIIGVKAAAKGVVDTKPLSRPPRIVPKTSTLPSCKPAPVSMQLKDDSKKVSSGLGVNHHSVMAFNKTQGGSCISTSRENSSATPTRGSGPGTVVFCSSYASPVSSSSHSAANSPLETARKRSSSRNSDHSSSPSTTKTPSRTSKIRSAPSNAKPTLGFSSRVSSQSSISSMVSDSSSSASYNTRISYSVESLDASPTSSHSSTVPSRSQHMSKASLGNRTVPEPSTRDHSRSINSNTGSKCVKPSGLRMPTPKIGYFDAAEKTLVCSSNKSPQASLRNSLVKSATGASKTAGPNKLKYSKIFPIKSAAQDAASNTAGANKLKSFMISHIKSPKTC